MLASGCSDAAGPTALTTDVDVARASWTANQPQFYRYELLMTGAWFTGHYLVYVANDEVVDAVTLSGTTSAQLDVPTLDEIWDLILSARTSGDINSVEFNEGGIPVRTDLGPWELDGGVYFSVSRFRSFSRLTTARSFEER
jgi:hypothetical protein